MWPGYLEEPSGTKLEGRLDEHGIPLSILQPPTTVARHMDRFRRASATTSAGASSHSHGLKRSFTIAAILTTAALVGSCSDATGPTIGPPGLIESMDGDGQTGPAGEWLDGDLVVRVTDVEGNPVADHAIAWEVVDGEGEVEPLGAATNSLGLAAARWRPGATSDVQRTAAYVGEPADSVRTTFQATVPVATVDFDTHDPAMLVGESQVLRATVRDSGGTELIGGLVWESSDPVAASILPHTDDPSNATLTANLRAEVEIVVTSEQTSTPVDSSTIEVSELVRGSIRVAGSIAGEAPWSSAWAHLMTDGFVDSIQVDGEGTFALRLPPGDMEHVEVTVQDRAQEPGFIPVLARRPVGSLAADTTYIVLPATWTVEDGAHAGVTSPISADLLKDVGGVYFDVWPVTDTPAFEWASWPPGDRPIPVALGRSASDLPITEADSIALWDSLRNMEGRFGLTLFEPVPEDEMPGSPGGIVIAIDSELGGPNAWSVSRITGTPQSWMRTHPLDGWRGSMVAEFVELNSNVQQGTLEFGAAGGLSNGPLVEQLFTFLLGLRFHCDYPSVMATSNCPELQSDQATAQDVAYWHLKEAIREAQMLEGGTSVDEACCVWFGAVTSVFGERVLDLGLPPLPVPPVPSPTTPMAAGAGGDSGPPVHDQPRCDRMRIEIRSSVPPDDGRDQLHRTLIGC
jgi:hypothetical protein